MNESRFIDGFLSELKATLSEETGDAILRRINAERLLQLAAEQLVAEHEARHIRVLNEDRVADKPGVQLADYLIQIDDYDVRVELLDAPEDKPILKSEQLVQYKRLLQENPSTAALILTWTTNDLLSIPMSLARIAYLERGSMPLRQLIERHAHPFSEVLSEVIERQEKVWKVEIGLEEGITGQISNYPQVFKQAFERAIAHECERSFRKPMRKEAARTYDLNREKRTIMRIFKEAMSGTPSKALQTQLMHKLKGGRK
jgi:hypothetical protein